MELIEKYKRMSKQSKLNIQFAICLVLLAINLTILAGITITLSNNVEEQNTKIEQLEQYQDSTNASLVKIISEMKGIGG